LSDEEASVAEDVSVKHLLYFGDKLWAYFGLQRLHVVQVQHTAGFSVKQFEESFSCFSGHRFKLLN
jgi:hypothetical protein